MDEKMKQYGKKVADLFSKVSKKTWRIIIAVTGVLVIAAVILAVVLMDKTYVPLFRELSSEDMTSIINYLNEQNITDYKVQNNDTILVPEAMEPSLKARVMGAGYPSSSDHYQLYKENVGSLSTQSDRNTFFKLDLQERLGSTIECFDNVREAHVFITPGENNNFVLNRDNTINASATVVVTTRNGRLTDEVASAIRRAVNHAVEGLNFDQVTIEDQNGTSYIDTDNISSMSDESLLRMMLESEQNAVIRRSILDLLTPVFGAENVSVGVNTTVDVSHNWEENVRYYLPEYAQDGSTDGKGIIGRRVFSGEITRDANQTEGGVPGTTDNADLTEYVESADAINGNETGLSVHGEYDYQTNQDTLQREYSGGVVTDCMVSVTINAQPGSINVQDWVSHVARAVTFFAGLTAWEIYAAIAGLAVFLLLIILIMVFVSRGKKKRKAQEEALLAEQQAAAALAAEQQAALLAAAGAINGDGEAEPPKTGANIMEIHTERSMELRRDVRAFAENNPEVAAYMIKSWLKGDEDENG